MMGGEEPGPLVHRFSAATVWLAAERERENHRPPRWIESAALQLR